ncbi:MAG TPA: hypothetical protein VGI39_08170 [Polyangiaceae bacterium]|jgi:hypothetical protein
MSGSELERYQTRLLEVLGGPDLGREERMRVLREDPAFAPYADYVAGFDAGMIDFMAGVARTWLLEKK